MARLARNVIGTLVAVSLAISSAPARADSAAGAPNSVAPACEASINGQTSTGVTLPSNAPALLLLDAPASTTIAADLVVGEKRIPFAPPARDSNGLTALTLPIHDAGVHSVALSATCNGYSIGPRETTLTLTEEVALPTAIGTLTLVPKDPPTGLDTVTLTPTANLRAFLPATRLSVSVDGGAGVTVGSPASSEVSFTAKTGTVCVENGELLRDKRNAKITVGAAIAGVAEALPPITLDVTVDCGAIRWTTERDFPRNPDGTPTAAPGESTSEAGDGGCSAGPGAKSKPTVAPALAAIALASLVSARRRRRA